MNVNREEMGEPYDFSDNYGFQRRGKKVKPKGVLLKMTIYINVSWLYMKKVGRKIKKVFRDNIRLTPEKNTYCSRLS